MRGGSRAPGDGSRPPGRNSVPRTSYRTVRVRRLCMPIAAAFAVAAAVAPALAAGSAPSSGSFAATGGRLDVAVRAGARSLGRRGSGSVRVGHLGKAQLRPGSLRFAVALDGAAKRAERRAGRLTVTVELSVQPPGDRPSSLTRR